MSTGIKPPWPSGVNEKLIPGSTDSRTTHEALPYRYVKGDGEMEITGCMTRPKKSGPNKGRPKYLRHEGERTVVVTAQDVERHKRALLEQHPS